MTKYLSKNLVTSFGPTQGVTEHTFQIHLPLDYGDMMFLHNFNHADCILT